MSNPYEAFDRDVPECMREDVMTMLAEAAHVDGVHKCVTILERDRLDAINVRVHGIIEIDGEEHSFQLQDGDWGGTELLSWDDGREFEHHVPTRWALQPQRHLINEAMMSGKGSFLLLKWDAILKNRPKVAEIPGKYSYDRYVQPGAFVEKHWRDAAAKHLFDIVTQETADETRRLLSEAA